MKVTANVIADLMPLYLAGEASPDTRALVETYLRENPDFAHATEGTAERALERLRSARVELPGDHERTTLERVRRFNRHRTHLLAFCVGYTLLPLSFQWADGQVVWWMVRDSPKQALFFWIAAVGCWIGYYLMGRRLHGGEA